MEKKVNDLYSKKAIYLPNSLHQSIKYKPPKLYSKNSNKKNTLVMGAMGRLVKKKGFEFLIKTLPSPVEKNGLKKYLKENNFKNLKDAIRYNNRRS